ncbi:hypothetical protein [Parapedobacter indicus]|uniref:Uncharacterized protein n=1 Tax=Parapedobacter indicus TaxID=1477437 RepID=A0A1I3VIP0_9SPHI|nr:hypothetical protein [Parapedobacter indicus]PPK98284.1 hypothetical protein CLV26_11722 [Parapedobacter indicus]SFJ95115.1 hypothetical protein SAMN05444682_11726 [Parapedobacter indicus]
MIRIHGGAQRKIWAVNFILLFLMALTCLMAILLIYSILQENIDLINKRYHTYFGMRILDTKTCASLFITLIGLLLVRHHFLIGFMPILVYETRRTKKPTFDAIFENCEVWQVKVKNVGLGAAKILKYEFRLNQSEIEDTSHDKNFDETIVALNDINIVYDKDFCLEEITSGYTLPSKDEMIIFEINTAILSKLRQLDLQITFSGLLGNRFVKDVFLIPRIELGAEEKVANN